MKKNIKKDIDNLLKNIDLIDFSKESYIKIKDFLKYIYNNKELYIYTIDFISNKQRFPLIFFVVYILYLNNINITVDIENYLINDIDYNINYCFFNLISIDPKYIDVLSNYIIYYSNISLFIVSDDNSTKKPYDIFENIYMDLLTLIDTDSNIKKLFNLNEINDFKFSLKSLRINIQKGNYNLL